MARDFILHLFSVAEMDEKSTFYADDLNIWTSRVFDWGIALLGFLQVTGTLWYSRYTEL